jgi:hypothetical protein
LPNSQKSRRGLARPTAPPKKKLHNPTGFVGHPVD